MDPFTFWVCAGAVLGLVQVARHAPRDAVIEWLDAALLVLLGALIGARLYFALLHLSYFRSHLLEVPQFWLGGLDWPGAVLGGLVVMFVISAVRNLPVGFTADRLAHLVPPLSIGIWAGCWAIGCEYLVGGVIFERLPVPLLAAFSLLCWFGWLEIRVSHPLPPGRRAALIGLGLALNLLGFSFLRSDPYPVWMGFRPDVWAAGAFAVSMLAACLLSLTWNRSRAGEMVESID